MLRADHLSVAYGPVEAVREVSLGVTPGRVLLLLGANGAGKTTTLKAISGLVKSMHGRVTLEEEDVTEMPIHRRVRKGLALVPEGRRVFASLSVLDNLRVGAYTQRRGSEAKLREMLAMFPILEQRSHSPAGLLSGGEQQMLAFARALMSQPRYILMDEPSTGLAPAMVEQVLGSVRAIADADVGVLVVEQNAELGIDIADHVLVLSRGSTVFDEPAAKAQGSREIVRALLGEESLIGIDE